MLDNMYVRYRSNWALGGTHLEPFIKTICNLFWLIFYSPRGKNQKSYEFNIQACGFKICMAAKTTYLQLEYSHFAWAFIICMM